MYTKLAVFGILLLFSIMIVPAYAEVTSVSLVKSFYTDEEGIVFEGKESTGGISVFVIIRDEDGTYEGMVSDTTSDADGTFSTIAREVEGLFSSKGIYFATAFTDDQKEKDGITLELEYDGNKVFLIPDFDLQLKSISDKTIEEEKTLSFTVGITEALSDLEYSLEKNPPTGATIDSETGKFTWRPTSSQATGSYSFDIVVKKGGLEDRESIRITVTEKPEPQQPTQTQPTKTEPPEPTKTEPKDLGLASFVDETKDPQSYVDRYNTEESYKKWFDDNYPEYSSIYQAVGLEEPVETPAFVDPSQDPQYYVDRYNTEASYKEWFDDNYPDITIYQAVGLEEPVETPAFVDPSQDPQYYVDRYNTEASYKEWFDDNYPDITIYQAVGLEEPKEPEEMIGECGTGTILVDGVCTPEKSNEGGGCLIATATYGSEMAPQVQYLREIRDGKVMSTESGISFMTGFNSLYYSFSPYIADYERENPVFKEMVKVGITPLLSSLSVMSLADSEEEILGYGIGVILMNLGMYVAAPAMLIYGARKFIRI
ncbi:MAG: Ig domain-containing protein [Nitrosopumilus sp.]|nr:Ig domain-containing protein [Nitrosopumilus sp.]MDH3735798.1 Ig domain-containing protein [Nitrosopumilus sp.]MDH3833586.1 Ig domain-containing protein [Nitrosopumilus sp.]